MKTTTARFSKGTTKNTQNGLEIVLIRADGKKDAQAAIMLAKAWLRQSGCVYKLVNFVHTIGSQWSSLDHTYTARIAYKMPV